MTVLKKIIKKLKENSYSETEYGVDEFDANDVIRLSDAIEIIDMYLSGSEEGVRMLELGYFKTAASAVETIRFYRDINPDFGCTLKRVKMLGKPIWILRRWKR